MNDPREHAKEDLYSNLSSDEGEQDEISEQLKAIERQKQDLLERLKKKKERKSKLDPNFVQVPSSPKKSRVVELKPTSKPIDNNEEEEEENPNEVALMTKDDSNYGTTSYFMEKFYNSKKDHERKVVAYSSMMSSRVHTFSGTGSKKEFKPTDVDELDQYSNLWLRSRYIPVDELNLMLLDIKILRLPKLFAKVRPPKFTEPQYSNWVVTGIITSKDDIKYTSSSKPTKYFKFTISDFQHNLDVFIFGVKGVEKYYNLRVGDVVAILNPEILPWRPSENSGGSGSTIKSFNLRISHKFDCILEIGASRDLGWCPIPNASKNTLCKTPINKSKEDKCQYHREIQFRKTTSNRVELSGTYALGAPTKVDARPALYQNRGTSNNSRVQKSYNMVSDSHYQKRKDSNKLETRMHHFSTMNSAKAFFDEDFQNPDILNNLDSKRRKIKDSKMERNLVKALKNTVDKESKNFKNLKNATQATLQTGILQRLGFDPTGGKLSSVIRNSNSETEVTNKYQMEKKEALDDLMTFRKDTVNLKPSKDDLIKRRIDRQRNWKKLFGKQQSSIDNNDDSGSDLKILHNSSTKDQKYQL
ncbi:hypothetical protein Kpol_1043p71 [Vanderwaltozyma polyspora DSM 70294]|uniref:Uncharacterized protein n=1 Tax=Vanderwaltozyma polyspora (strain ATCC 22028 / DSM 70294 / BCRC 21397 / CBS 2163 / NBRC 10782 / NRRL Y-8283 / UCD 57-17) TaxID=436907 RepID=A7TIT8_VANPO|nr:uncharacterized protein Kpol_1043p71 [Vanderwaltozyma polyspora DSM 70294]EDO17880.1 hypothetical protein Kpol_1043p71 [Vanderwaltozyma polyspora DSM 70294]